MFKHLILCAFVPLLLCASEFRDNYFMDGTLEKVTTSDIPGCKWVKNHKSLKLSPSSFKLQPRPWEPLPSEMTNTSGLISPEFGDVDNDGDIDLLVYEKRVGKIILFKNIGTPYSPLFKKDKEILADQPRYNVALGDVDQDGILDLLTFYLKNGTESEIHGYKGIGNSEFQRYPDWDIKAIPPAYRADITGDLGDLDNDGDPDLIILAMDTILGCDNVDIKFFAYENKNNSFIQKPEWNPFAINNESIGSGWNASLDLVDIDKNNTLDCIFTYNEHGSICMYKNIGTSSPIWKGECPNLEGKYSPLFFSHILEYPEGDFIAGSIDFADLDNDGDPDA
ncbi:MAG: VCBS repeat-containing protein, partial [bacterium]